MNPDDQQKKRVDIPTPPTPDELWSMMARQIEKPFLAWLKEQGK